MTGSAGKIRKTNRRNFNFKSGYVSLSVPMPASKYNDPNRPAEHTALFPADKFVETFADNNFLQNHLAGSAESLIKDWEEQNAGPGTVTKRTNVERVFTLMSNRWTNFRRGEERAEYELQLNSYK
jgi:hypothetical protein